LDLFLVLKRSTSKLSKKSPTVRQSVSKRVSKQKKVPKKNSGEKKREKKLTKQQVAEPKKSSRPLDEVVLYPDIEFEVKEIIAQGNTVMIGPPRLTRFERARITGARSLQLSLGAPSLIPWTDETRDTISIATAELDAKALPISIRRILPNGLYQDIPVEWMK
jgi:DNA-directed RNA polymerases I, II, and III subunit RPABC2